MYTNDSLTKLSVSEKDAGMGYKQKIFRKTGLTFPVDKQPYSAVMAKKEYGLGDEGIKWRCYTQKKGLANGDYVQCGKERYVVLLVNDWENHSEIVLGVFKDG